MLSTSPVWIITSPEWTLPVTAEISPYGFAEMYFDLPLFPLQTSTLKEWLLTKGATDSGDYMSMESAAFRKIAQRWHTDPSEAIIWAPSRQKMRPTDERMLTGIMVDEFCADLVKQGWFKDLTEARIVYTAICQLMLDWMVREYRPVPLMFASLVASPYRTNWPAIMIARRGKAKTGLGIFRSFLLMESAHTFKAYFEFLLRNQDSEDCLAWEPGGRHLVWNLHVKHHAPFYRAIAKREKKATTGFGRSLVSYLRNAKAHIAKLLDWHMEIFADWCAQARRPVPRLFASYVATKEAMGNGRKKPIVWPSGSVAKPGDHCRSASCFGDPYPRPPDSGSGQLKILVGQVNMARSLSQLLSLLDFQPQAQDMRGRSEHVHKRNGQPGTPGVLVPDGGSVQVEEKELLAL